MNVKLQVLLSLNFPQLYSLLIRLKKNLRCKACSQSFTSEVARGKGSQKGMAGCVDMVRTFFNGKNVPFHFSHKKP